MTIETKAREWAEKEYTDLTRFPNHRAALISLLERAYLAGAAEAVRWVPVSEQLPEEGQFLVIGENVNGKQIVISDYSKKYGFTSIANVTHWMPLPPHHEKEQL